MGRDTAISWCNHTFNIWWGCEHSSRDDPDGIDADSAAISEECRNCYAESFDNRLGGSHWGPGAEPRWFGDAYWAKPIAWNAAAKKTGVRARVFCSSMADWAQRHRDPAVNAKMDAARARMWALIRRTPWLDWLLLTKRAERLPELLPWMNLSVDPPRPLCLGCADKAVDDGLCDGDGLPCDQRQPWPNVWTGVTCGTRSSLWRVRKLREVRSVVRYVSGEPLLEHITDDDWDGVLARDPDGRGDIDQLIIGDESGGNRRPLDVDWVRTARDAAHRHGVAFHLKQLHVGGKKVHLPILDGRKHDSVPE